VAVALAKPVLGGVRILVAEDEDDIREALADWLQLEGAGVTTAESGDAAFAAFLRERPDIIVSDLWMPNGSGYDFIKRVRQLRPEEGGLVPAIALSAAENMPAALMAGFHVFVAKPFDVGKLMDILADFARKNGGQAASPWTLTAVEPGHLLVTLAGRVEGGDMRAMTRALLVHLEQGPIELVSDLRRLTSFAPSVGSIAERALWARRDRIRAVRVIGGSFLARVVSAAACKVLGVPCTFCETLEGAARSEP